MNHFNVFTFENVDKMAERVLGNGIRLRMLPSDDADRCQICLVIPAGENQEGPHRPQAAHACEHICCAFNGGFRDSYGFLRLRDEYGIMIGATTHADHTRYCLINIPCTQPAIHSATRFLAGIFAPAGFRGEAGMKEMRVIESEIHGDDPAQSLMWTMSYWIRQGDGRPTEAAIHHAGIPSLSIDTALTFHKEFYQPSRCVITVCAPEKGRAFAEWDASLLRYMSDSGQSGGGRMTPNRYIPGKPTPAGCAACSIPRGIWEVPMRAKHHWLLCAIPFWAGSSNQSLAEVRARSLVATCCRLSGSSDLDIMTLTDLLRAKLGITYSLNGTTMYITDKSGRKGCVAILGAVITRDLEHSEVGLVQEILRRESTRMPGRGGLGGLTAWFVKNRQPKVVRETMKRCGLPFVDSLSWEDIRTSHDTTKIQRGDYCIAFSSHSS